MKSQRDQFVEGLATFCKYEADGCLTEFFQDAYEMAFDRMQRVPWYRPLRKQRRRQQMDLLLVCMTYSIELANARTGAEEAMRAVNRVYDATVD